MSSVVYPFSAYVMNYRHFPSVVWWNTPKQQALLVGRSSSSATPLYSEEDSHFEDIPNRSLSLMPPHYTLFYDNFSGLLTIGRVP